MLMGFINSDGFAFSFDFKPYNIRFFNSEKKMIFDEDERNIEKEIMNCSIGTKWTDSFTTRIFDRGRGLLVKTNKRIFFFREITTWDMLIHRDISDAVSPIDGFKAKNILGNGGSEFFNIPINEVIGIKKKIFTEGLSVCILSDNKECHMTIHPVKTAKRLFEGFPYLK